MTRSVAGSPRPNQAAEAAFRRTITSRQALPLSDQPSGGPVREGVSRLRGAFAIAIEKVRPDPDQPRRQWNQAEQANLTASVAGRGIKQPLRVWYVESEAVYQIISGERRYRAALAAGLRTVPCIVEDAPPASATPPRREILVDQIVENWQREDLNPYDLSDALKELRDVHGLSQEEIAHLTGKPKSEISRFLAMQRVAPEVQQTIRTDREGRFSRRHVVALSRLDPESQAEVAEKVRAEKLTAVETEREAARRVRRDDGGEARGAPVTVRRYAVGSARVKITFRKRDIAPEDVLEVLDRVRDMIERDRMAGIVE